MSISSVGGPQPGATIAPPPIAAQPGKIAGNETPPTAAQTPVAVAPVAKVYESARSSAEEVESAVKKVQNFVSAKAADIQFSIDEDIGVTVVKVVDRGTKEVIRQIPSEEMLEIAKALDKLQGLLVKQQA
ncbi:MAG: flagellar protein FlaG [Rhodocyclales bacterium]|nr:flagellar protein FlaG [Rhodocyclales bacterium]